MKASEILERHSYKGGKGMTVRRVHCIWRHYPSVKWMVTYFQHGGIGSHECSLAAFARWAREEVAE